LETVLGGKLVEAVESQRCFPGQVNEGDLSADSVNLVMHARVGGRTAGIVGDLPTVVTGRADFEQQRVVFLQRQELADAPSPPLQWKHFDISVRVFSFVR